MHIRRWIFVAVVVMAAGYFFYEARGVIFAPRLEIFEPKDGAVLMSAEIHIAGKTDSNLAVWVAGKIFPSDKKGIFFSNAGKIFEYKVHANSGGKPACKNQKIGNYYRVSERINYSVSGIYM